MRPLGPGASNPHRAAPRIAYSVRGVLPTSALDHADGVALLEELDEDRYAQSSKAPKASHINTWVKLHVRWFGGDIPPLPLTVESVRAVAAQMKGAGYRSFPNYLDTMAHAHKKEHDWSAALDDVRKATTISCMRGIGPSRQTLEFPIQDVQQLGLGPEALHARGPVLPYHWAVLCTFHMLRGAEAACALASSLVVDAERCTESFSLSGSKTDPQAIGVVRTWGCVCSGNRDLPCPYHSAVAIQDHLMQTFGINGVLPIDMPLFPDEHGQWCTGAGFISTITVMIRRAGIREHDALGRSCIGEHVWRISGARHLAALDVPTPIIMRLARWESAIVLRYIADAPLSPLTRVYMERAAAASAALRALMPAGIAAASDTARSSASSAVASPPLPIDMGPCTDVLENGEVDEMLNKDLALLDDAEDLFIRHKGTGRTHHIARGCCKWTGDEELITLCGWIPPKGSCKRLETAVVTDPKFCKDCTKQMSRLVIP